MSAFDLWRRAKEEAPAGCVALVRDGDYYVTFGMDACQVAAVLGMPMYRRDGMDAIGVPYHSVELYLMKLVKAGKKVVLGDPIEGAVPLNPLMEGGQG